MIDDRTPDPAVQVVFSARMEAWRKHGVSATDEEIVAALREAGHIKNLRQVGWAYWLKDYWHLCAEEPKAWDRRTPVYVEEGER